MKKGFTLVELLAVIAVLSVIMSVALFSVVRVRNNSLEKIVETKIDLIEQAAILYGQENPNELNNKQDNGCTNKVINTENNNGDVTSYTINYCLIKTTGELIDEGYFNSGDLDETEGTLDLINDVTDQTMRNDTVIIYRRNNRIYSIMDCIASNGDTCS